MNNIRQNVGYVLLYLFSLHLAWRPLAALLLAFPVIGLACLLPLPETPYWLARWETVIKLSQQSFLSPTVFYPVLRHLRNLDLVYRQGRLEEARQSLAWLREGEHFLEEEHEILEVDVVFQMMICHERSK